MRLSRLISFALLGVGAASTARLLKRRVAWEAANRRAAICVDFDDAYAAAIRAGMLFPELLAELRRHGATHVSLPELTLDRLRASGQLTPLMGAWGESRGQRAGGGARAGAGAGAGARPAPTGHWNYLHGEAGLVAQAAAELAARLPYTQAQASKGVDSCASTLTFAGDLRVLGGIGLGFDAIAAEAIRATGLGAIPRPVSYAWPEGSLIEQTLAQAAVFGCGLVAFDGDLILGHEMHLDETLEAMERHGLAFVYFAESRHQKGDWFVAKRLAPRVVLAHRFTPAEMLPLDLHAAAHRWALLARERGIRLCYVNFFGAGQVHAAGPLEGLHYVEHVREALQEAGFEVGAEVLPPAPARAPVESELALAGLASAGTFSLAASSLLRLPEPASAALAAGSAVGAAALPYLDRPRGHLEVRYPPSYAPKLLALGVATTAPIAAMNLAADGPAGLAAGLGVETAAAMTLAALISGPDYHLRVEEFRGFNLDLFLPLAAAALRLPNQRLRLAALAGLAITWVLTRASPGDLLSRIDAGHAEGHTHHLSAASRMVGDLGLALGPRPARKWAGLGAAGAALSQALSRAGRPGWAGGAAAVGMLGYVLALEGFRRPERPLKLTAQETAISGGLGAAVGLLLSLAFELGRWRPALWRPGPYGHGGNDD